MLEAAKPLTDDAPASASVSADVPKIDNFDQSDGSLFEVKDPHKIEAGILHLQASSDGTVLLSSLEGLSTEGYTASVTVMPPGVSEYAGLAFAVRGESSRILFYVYRPAGANRFGKQCSIGVEGYIGDRKIRAPDIRAREIDLELNTPSRFRLARLVRM